MIVSVLVAAAAALLLWPSKPIENPFSQKQESGPDYMSAVRSLQTVTKRLASTKKLSEAEKKALDVIVLALSSGSAE